MSPWNVSTLTAVSSDTEPTLVVNFGTAKYVFNAGEGMGRAWLESHHTFRRTKGLFLTGVGSQRCGGIAGFLMLCADASLSTFDLIGPYGLSHYLATMRSYTYRPTMTVKAVEATSTPVTAVDPPTPVYQDENITVYPIPLFPSSHESSSDQLVDRSLKRKRSTSPPTTSKRPFSGPRDSAETSVTVSPLPSALATRAQSNDFSPSTLSGKDAQEWRRLMLREMFPLEAPPEADRSLSKKAKREARENHKDASASKPSPSGTLRISNDHKNARLPRFAPVDEDVTALPTLGYLVVGPSIRGKFDVKKAEELGLPRGPIRSQLTKGETVTFEVDDGQGGRVQRTVRPEDCIGPTETPQSILILDVPTPHYIPSLVASFEESPFLFKYRSKSAEDREQQPVVGVYHICGEGVLEDERYKRFMNGFADETHHIVSSRAHTPNKITFQHSALVQGKFNQLDPEMFPVPKYDMSPARELSSVTGLPSKTILWEAKSLIQVRPVRPPTRDEQARDCAFDSLVNSKRLPELSSATDRAFAKAKSFAMKRMRRNSPASEPGDDVVVTPLGTASAVPTRIRNVSATLIQIPGHGNILLDCGEGTWGQLARSFGDDPGRSQGVWEVLRALRCIFLSHMHGDHHMGLSKILAMRMSMKPPPEQPLYVVGQRQHFMYLIERQEIEDQGLGEPGGIVMVLSDALNWRFVRPYGSNLDDEPFMNAERSRENAQAMCRVLGLSSFTTVDVMHRVRCYGVVIRHRDGWSIAFSGDTMPTENLVKAGRDVTLLIHESSMSPEQEALAREKAHSTSAQAIDVGRRMGAKKILLTHFSARYPGMPPRQGGRASEGVGAQPLVGLAFDFARLRMGDMWKLNTYLPALQSALEEFGDDEAPAEIDVSKLQ